MNIIINIVAVSLLANIFNYLQRANELSDVLKGLAEKYHSYYENFDIYYIPCPLTAGKLCLFFIHLQPCQRFYSRFLIFYYATIEHHFFNKYKNWVLN